MMLYINTVHLDAASQSYFEFQTEQNLSLCINWWSVNLNILWWFTHFSPRVKCKLISVTFHTYFQITHISVYCEDCLWSIILFFGELYILPFIIFSIPIIYCQNTMSVRWLVGSYTGSCSEINASIHALLTFAVVINWHDSITLYLVLNTYSNTIVAGERHSDTVTWWVVVKCYCALSSTECFSLRNGSILILLHRNTLQ